MRPLYSGFFRGLYRYTRNGELVLSWPLTKPLTRLTHASQICLKTQPDARFSSSLFRTSSIMFRTVKLILQPILDALFKPGIRWRYRWRLLVLQPISILTYLVTAPSWMLSRAYTVSWIPTREGRSVRALIFQPRKRKSNRLHPLHLDIHGGGFLGGFPEYEAKFTSLLCERTEAVVISTQYRYVPVHPFPAAIDDVDDVVQYIHQNAERLWGAGPNLMTVSGFSAGGDLALAACQQPVCHAPSLTAIKASVTFYAPISVHECG